MSSKYLQTSYKKGVQLLLSGAKSYFDYCKDGAYQYRSIFARFMTMREKQILARTIGIQKRKLGVTTHFLDIIKQQLF